MSKCLPFRWYGGKYSHLNWILPQLPQTHQYVEPFGGSAAVLLNRDPSPVETFNDLDSDVTNFFKVLRDRKEELLEKIALTPFSREEFRKSIEKQNQDDLSDLERARLFFIRAGQVRSGLAQEATPGRWAYCKSTSRRNMSGAVSRWLGRFKNLEIAAERLQGKDKPRDIVKELEKEERDKLVRRLKQRGFEEDAVQFREEEIHQLAERLLTVQIENKDALDVIQRHDDGEALFYCDPPYPHQSREESSTSTYRYEMSDDDHRELSKVLHQCEGKVAISSYRCELTEELYSDWNRIDISKTTHTSKKVQEESLWLNYPIPAPDQEEITITQRLG